FSTLDGNGILCPNLGARLRFQNFQTAIITKLREQVSASTLNPTNHSDYRKIKKGLPLNQKIEYADAWSVVFRICCDQRTFFKDDRNGGNCAQRRQGQATGECI
ncbi:uncharacterized protein LY79DRAFT_643021, partial [Colletotrichum navitas]